MKKLLLLFVLGSASASYAQVEIVQADFPVAGETITFGKDNAIDAGLNFSLGAAGASQTYDFSMLVTDELTQVGFYNPNDVQSGSDFPGSDLAVDQIGGIYAFATVGSGEVNIIGLGGDFAGQLGSPIPIVVSLPAINPWKLFEFPASINSPILIDTAVFMGEFFSDGLIPSDVSMFWDPDSVRLKRTVYYSAEIDADGTLTDPIGGTHSVIRMQVEETSIDTIWGWTQADGWKLPTGIAATVVGPQMETVIRTRYIGKEVGYYVADIITNAGTPLSGSFVSNQSQCCTGIEEVVAAGQTVLYPNPTSNNVRVRTGGDIYQLNIMDMSGKLLQSERLTVDGQTVELSSLANGLYVYQMLDEAGNAAHTGRLSVIK